MPEVNVLSDVEGRSACGDVELEGVGVDVCVVAFGFVDFEFDVPESAHF